MNTRLATIVSIAGVLIAGSAAALVNAQALSGGGSQAVSSLPDLRAATSTSTLTPESSSSVIAVEPSGSAHVLTIGDAGTVTVGASGDILRILAVDPAAGWLVSNAEALSETTVVVVFGSPAAQLRASVELADGTIITMVDRFDGSISATSVPSGPPPSTTVSTITQPLSTDAPSAATATAPAVPSAPVIPADAPTTAAPGAPQPPTVTTSDDVSTDETQGREEPDDTEHDDEGDHDSIEDD